MSRRGRTLLPISDFNVSTFAGYLRNDAPEVEVLEAPFGQVGQLAYDATHPIWRSDPDVAFVWTRPEAQSKAFSALVEGGPVPASDLDEDVDAYVEILRRVGERVGTTIVASWSVPPGRLAFQTLDMRPGAGVRWALTRMNLRLAERIDELPGCHLLDAAGWMATQGDRAFNPKLWYMSKTAFGHGVLKEAVAAVRTALATIGGSARKLIVLDLDNTLWGGIVGEVGWEGLKLGGHDPVGEAFADFQRTLRAFTRRGVVLGIVSRNEEDVALEAIRRHPEMVLSLDDFAGWRIGWGDKARNVEQLVSDLNLGLDAAVFIDDDPFQRARVREALPRVLVPEWPVDVARYSESLWAMSCFDSTGISEEDRSRTRLYASELKRKEVRGDYASPDAWLMSLDTRVVVEELNASNLQRVAQLLNKTNQMNMATRRMSEAELTAWAEEDGRSVWAFRTVDKFGDLGITGLLSLDVRGGEARVEDFLLSCRVMGRKVEESMVAWAVDRARAAGAATLSARYRPTERNRPCLAFWESSGFDAAPGADGEREFEWPTRRDYPVPPQVQLQRREDPAPA